MVSPLITDYDIQALIDSELDWEEEKRVRQHIQDNPQVRERYSALLRQKQLLRTWFSHGKNSSW